MASCSIWSRKKLFCAISCTRIAKQNFKMATELATNIVNIVQELIQIYPFCSHVKQEKEENMRFIVFLVVMKNHENY